MIAGQVNPQHQRLSNRSVGAHPHRQEIKPGFIAGIIILGAGLYMVFTAWGWSQAQIDVSLGAFLLMSVLAPAINSHRFKAIRQAIASEPDGLLTDEISQLTHDPVLRASTFTMGFMTSGIVCLMTTKPGQIGAAAIMAVAFVGSLIAARLPLGVARSVQPVAQPSPMEAAPEEELIHSQ